MKNILIITSEYSSDSRPNERWTKIVSYFAQEWAKDNNIIVVINSTKFPKFYYYFGFLLRNVVAKLYHKDPKYIEDQQWREKFDYMDGRIKVYNRPILKFYPHSKYFKFQLRRQAQEIVNILKTQKIVPDIIDGHWLYPQLDIIHLLKKQYQAKTALVLHGAATKNNRYGSVISQKLNLLDKVGCRNKTLANSVYKELHLKEVPFVCPSGLPDTYSLNRAFNKRVLSSNTISIVTTCRLLNWKCIDETVKGIEKAFHGEDYQYDIIGEGPEYKHISDVIKELDIQEKVSLVGRIPRAEVQSKLGGADIFVMISKHETFGLVYLEAMIQGCITIGSKQGGIDGIIEDGINGFLCEEGNADDLAKVLYKIKTLSQEEKSIISQKAIETALYYTDSKVAQRYLNNIS